jgi:hypothetical protein
MIKFVSLSVLLCLAACAPNVKELQITTKPLEIDVAKAADPIGVTMLPVNFRVINKDNLNRFLDELKQQQGGDNPVFFAIDTKDYENISLNIADIIRYIKQQQSIIIYYRTLIEPLMAPINDRQTPEKS